MIPLDGVGQLSSEWILKNMPELTNIKFTMYAPGCMSAAIVVAAQAVGSGLCNTCLVLKGWHNLEGRYNHGGISAADEVPGTFRHKPRPYAVGRSRLLRHGVAVCAILHQIRQEPRHDGSVHAELAAERLAVPGGILGAAPSRTTDAGGLLVLAVDRQAR